MSLPTALSAPSVDRPVEVPDLKPVKSLNKRVEYPEISPVAFSGSSCGESNFERSEGASVSGIDDCKKLSVDHQALNERLTLSNGGGVGMFISNITTNQLQGIQAC